MRGGWKSALFDPTSTCGSISSSVVSLSCFCKKNPHMLIHESRQETKDTSNITSINHWWYAELFESSFDSCRYCRIYDFQKCLLVHIRLHLKHVFVVVFIFYYILYTIMWLKVHFQCHSKIKCNLSPLQDIKINWCKRLNYVSVVCLLTKIQYFKVFLKNIYYSCHSGLKKHEGQ